MDEVRHTLRMPLDVYNRLFQLVEPYIFYHNTQFRQAISPQERLQLTLRYLAFGDSPRTLSHMFRVGYCTVGRIIHKTTRALCHVLRDYLQTPTSTDEWRRIAQGFNDRWQFPNCFGVLDGKHCRIMKPRNSGTMFYNYKKYFSLVLLAICDSNYRFLWISIGAEGRAGDSNVWKQSPFFKALNHRSNPLKIPSPTAIKADGQKLPYVLLGDDAFPLSPCLMKPYAKLRLTEQQRIFNYRHSRARMCIENVFGIMSARFRILQKEINMFPHNASYVINAICHLHNYLRIHAGHNYIPQRDLDHEEEYHQFVPGNWRENNKFLDNQQACHQRNASQYSKFVRDEFADFFVNDGEVEWQYDRVFNNEMERGEPYTF